ncbi:MAG TPA: pitrilysin family protein [Vicinamibacterales bacterium]|nr:pitrilysin family protein [Vicinamibacterales bacterium]
MAAHRGRPPALGPERSFTFPDIHRTTLDNGLKVWTVEHHQVPLVSVLALVPAGASADPPDRPGLAAITGDMLDEGSGDRSALDVHEALGRIGAQLELDVGHDATVLGLTTLERYLDRGLELVRDMLIRPRFEQREFDRVRDLRLNRLLQMKDMPPALADRAFTQLLYRHHPYGHLPIGSEGSLRALMIRDIAAFHRRAYVPSRITLIAVGDAPHQALTSAIARAFADWRAESPDPIPDPDAFPAPAAPASRLALVHRSAAAQSELRIGHVALPRRSPDYHGALVANMILGGQFVSRINMNLREDKGYTYGARTAFEFRRAPGPFVLYASVQADATAAALRESIAEIRAIRGERPVTRQELELGRASLTRGYPRSFETADQIARAAAQLSLYGLPDDYFTSFVPTVLALTEDEVTAIAARHIDPAKLLSVVVGDREKVLPSLRALDAGDIADVSVT